MINWNSIFNSHKSSFFEQALRAINPTILPPFIQSKQSPISFHPSSQTLPCTLASSNSFLPALSLNVLEASSKLVSPSNKRIAVLFSGGPAPGGHNVIAGIKKVLGENNTLFGICNGPGGLLKGTIIELTEPLVQTYLHLGGFDLLGSDRTKIKTDQQFKAVADIVKQQQLDSLIIIGGDDSNTNAAFLADYLHDLGCTVNSVPKTIDGDLQYPQLLPISFGFDTASKIYSQLTGNLLQDSISSKKYWHFVKLMGRSASHITLEVALQTHPTLTFISEEIAEKKWTLNDIVTVICKTIISRAENNKPYGLVLIPEGLIEHIVDFKQLNNEISLLCLSMAKSRLIDNLSPPSLALYNSLPLQIQQQLMQDRDMHGNLKLSLIDSQYLLIKMIEDRLSSQTSTPFNGISHFFGYEGRCGAPTLFDASFTYNLGLIVGSLSLGNHSGYMASITDFNKNARPVGIPLKGLLTKEQRQSKETIVIKKTLVDLKSNAFKQFSHWRDLWVKNDLFNSPGPIQFSGSHATQLPLTIALNQDYNHLNFTLGHPHEPL